MTELKSLILKTMAAAGALLVMTSPASAYEPTARDLQQAAYAFLMGDWDYQFPMEGGETHLFFKNGADFPRIKIMHKMRSRQRKPPAP